MIDSMLAAPRGHALRRAASLFLQDRLLQLLLAVGVLLSLRRPSAIPDYWRWVDWSTILTLTGLLLLTKGIELSGYLDHLGHRIIGRLRTRRALALFLVAAAALLSMLLTNDVALFIVVPLTLGMRRVAGLPLARLVIFQALAVNAGSLLTPIGNPQNILLWQKSGLSFLAFTLQMLPLAASLLALLLVVTAMAFSSAPLALPQADDRSQGDTRMLAACSALYLAFLAAVEFGHPGWALPAVLAIMLIAYRPVLLEADWGLLAVFVLMFVDIRLLTGLGAVDRLLAPAVHGPQWQLYLAGLAGSQLVSNVPAAILLLKYLPAGKTIAYAVNAGGFGLVQGSMANLIALRMLGERRAWLRFHYWSLPFLLLGGVLGYLLL